MNKKPTLMRFALPRHRVGFLFKFCNCLVAESLDRAINEKLEDDMEGVVDLCLGAGHRSRVALFFFHWSANDFLV